LADAAGALVEVEFSEPPAAEAELVGLDPEKYRALTAQEENK
jgi:ribosome maturation factor RimP